MKNSAKINLMVGVFVILAVFSLLFLALNVSGITGFNGKNYKVKAVFSKTDGLKVRAKVTIAGVTIGRITKIELDPTKFNSIVTMNINSAFNTIPSNSGAAILTSGLIGEKYIDILVGSDEDNLEDGSIIYDTQSSLILEDLISKFLLNQGKK